MAVSSVADEQARQLSVLASGRPDYRHSTDLPDGRRRVVTLVPGFPYWCRGRPCRVTALLGDRYVHTVRAARVQYDDTGELADVDLSDLAYVDAMPVARLGAAQRRVLLALVNAGGSDSRSWMATERWESAAVMRRLAHLGLIEPWSWGVARVTHAGSRSLEILGLAKRNSDGTWSLTDAGDRELRVARGR